MKIQPNRQGVLPPHDSHLKSSPLRDSQLDGRQGDRSSQSDRGGILGLARRQWFWIAGIAAAVTAASAWGWQQTRISVYEGTFQLLIEPATTTEPLNGFPLVSGNETIETNVLETNIDYPTQVEILKSPKLLSPILSQLQQRYPDITYHSLFNREIRGETALQVERLDRTKIVEVRYRHTDPQQILSVLETLMQGYLKYGMEGRKTSLNQGIQFIDTQLPKWQERIDELQQQIEEFKTQNRLIDPDMQAQQLLGQMTQIQQQQIEAQTQLQQQQALYQTVRKQLALDPQVAIAAAALSESSRYQKLLEQLQELERELAQELTRFKEGSPPIEVLREQQNNITSLLQEEAQRLVGDDMARDAARVQSLASQNSLRRQLTEKLIDTLNQIEVLKARNTAIAREANRLGQALQKFPAIFRYYGELQRELQLANSAVNQLRSQKEALQFQIAQQDIPWEAIAQPELPRNESGEIVPLSPRFPWWIAGGAIGGLALGLGAAAIADRFDRRFHSTGEIETATQLPLLGKIPQRHIEAASEDSASFDSAFRTLNLNLHFLAERPIRSLVVSSPMPQDGKSTVALNLARIAATMGQRVLLVDANLRTPELHARLGLPPQPGLSHALVGDLNFNGSIQRSPLADPLFILPAGSLPPDPPRLLASDKMQHLAQQLQDAFDLVIYDTPAMSEVADARLLASRTDGLLMVMGLHRTHHNATTQVLAQLQAANTPILGIAVNGVKESEAVSYNSYRWVRQLEPENELPAATVEPTAEETSVRLPG